MAAVVAGGIRRRTAAPQGAAPPPVSSAAPTRESTPPTISGQVVEIGARRRDATSGNPAAADPDGDKLQFLGSESAAVGQHRSDQRTHHRHAGRERRRRLRVDHDHGCGRCPPRAPPRRSPSRCWARRAAASPRCSGKRHRRRSMARRSMISRAIASSMAATATTSTTACSSAIRPPLPMSSRTLSSGIWYFAVVAVSMLRPRRPADHDRVEVHLTNTSSFFPRGSVMKLASLRHHHAVARHIMKPIVSLWPVSPRPRDAGRHHCAGAAGHSRRRRLRHGYARRSRRYGVQGDQPQRQRHGFAQGLHRRHHGAHLRVRSVGRRSA